MKFTWYNPFTWPSYNGSNDNSIPVEYDVINGTRVKLSLDSFNMGEKRVIHYPKNFNKYVELAKNVYVVEDAISKICDVFSRVDFISDKPQDKIVKKLNAPNNYQSKQEFLKEFCFYINASGWNVLWKKYESYGNIDTMQLINLNPDKVEFTDTGDIEAEYNGNMERISKADFVVFYDSIRESNNRGYSKLRPMRSQVCNILDAQKAKGIKIENSGTTIVSPKVAPVSNQVDEGLNAFLQPEVPGQITQKQDIEFKLNNRGLENRVVVANKGLDALNIASQLNNFDFNSEVEPDILALYSAYGVEVELTPYGKNATYENKAVAELRLVQNKAIPLAESLIQSLVVEFKGSGVIEADFSKLDCMSIVEKRIEETNSNKINQAITLMQAGLVDENGAKEMLKNILP